MFDTGKLSTLKGKPLRDAIEEVVRTAKQNGTYTYTEHHLSQEPYRTMGFEYLDALRRDGDGKPISEGAPETWDGHAFLLVSLDASKGIKHGIVKDYKVAGTNRVKREKRPHDFGAIAEMPDAPGHRWARDLIFQQGWPVLQTMGGRETASLVEWNWLDKAAHEDDPAPGVVELYEQLLPRVTAYLAAKSSSGNGGPPTTEPAKRGPGRPKNTNNDMKSPGASPSVGV